MSLVILLLLLLQRQGEALADVAAPAASTIEGQRRISPIGSRTVRLPNLHGTRVRLFYPCPEEAVAAGYAYGPCDTDDRGLGGFRMGRRTCSGCVQDAPLTPPPDGAYPLLIYSHGIGSNMDSAVNLFRSVAAAGGAGGGAVVAAVEHTDGTASPYTVAPDGTELGFSAYFMTERQQLSRRASELLDAAEHVPSLLGASKGVDIGDTLLGGHGYGAPAAVMAANGAPAECKIEGLILHDPTLGIGYGMLPPNGAENRLPCVTYVSDRYHKRRVRYGSRTLHVKGSKHESFLDAPLWTPGRRLAGLSPLSAPDPAQVHEELADSMVAFLRTRNANSAEVGGQSSGLLQD